MMPLLRTCFLLASLTDSKICGVIASSLVLYLRPFLPAIA